MRAPTVCLIVLGALALATPVRAQDDDGGDGDGASGDAGQPPVTAGGVFTQESYPQAEVDRPLTLAQGAIAFGAPADGSFRLSAQWDTAVFTETAASGLGTAVNVTSWSNLFSFELDTGDFVGRVVLPLGYLRSALSPAPATGSGASDQAELGNVELEGYASIVLGAEHRLLIGGGVALPTATDQPCDSGACSGTGAIVRQISWVATFRNAPAWANQAFTLWPSVDYTLGVPWVLVHASAAIPIFFPTSSRIGGGPIVQHGNVDLMLSLDVSGAVRIVNVVDVGASFLAWALPSGVGYSPGPGRTIDLGQTALSFFVRTDPELDVPVNGGAEFILDLDNSWGPTGDTGKFWGLRFWLGGRFDV